MNGIKTIKEAFEKKEYLKTQPCKETSFKIGDEVIYTNESGDEYEMKVMGFSETDQGKRKPSDEGYKFIHLCCPDESLVGAAWWNPHSEKELIKK